MGRILSIDLGEKRVGLAISDEEQIIAQSLVTITYKNEEDLINQLKQIIQERQICEIVIGNPISLAGKDTKRSKWVENFKQKLTESIKLPIHLFDERLTSQLAARFLEETNPPSRERHQKRILLNKSSLTKHAIDRIAATIILEDFIAYKKNKKTI